MSIVKYEVYQDQPGTPYNVFRVRVCLVCLVLAKVFHSLDKNLMTLIKLPVSTKHLLCHQITIIINRNMFEWAGDLKLMPTMSLESHNQLSLVDINMSNMWINCPLSFCLLMLLYADDLIGYCFGLSTWTMCCVNSIEGWSDTKPMPLLQSSVSASKRGGDREGAIPRELSQGPAVIKAGFHSYLWLKESYCSSI